MNEYAMHVTKINTTGQQEPINDMIQLEMLETTQETTS